MSQILVSFTNKGLFKFFQKSDLSQNKKEIGTIAEIVNDVKIEVDKPIGFESIPEFVGIEYIGYIIDKESRDRVKNQWVRTDEYKLIGSNANILRDTRVAYDNLYRYRIRSVIKYTIKEPIKQDISSEFLENLNQFVAEKTKADIKQRLSAIRNQNLFNRGLAPILSSGIKKQIIKINEKYSIEIGQDGSRHIIDNQLRIQFAGALGLGLDNSKLKIDILSPLLSIELKSALNRVLEQNLNKKPENFKYTSFYYEGEPSEWSYVNTTETKLPSTVQNFDITIDSYKKLIYLYWGKPLDRENLIISYNIYRREKVGDEWKKLKKQKHNFFVDSNTEPGRKYIYAMSTNNRHGYESLLSAQIQAELNGEIKIEKKEKDLRFISGPGLRPDQISVVAKKFQRETEQIIVQRNIAISPRPDLSEDQTIMLIKIKSLDTHETHEIKLTLLNTNVGNELKAIA